MLGAQGVGGLAPCGVILTVAGGAERGSRPTPPTTAVPSSVGTVLTSLTIGCTRKTSCGWPSSPIRHTRPWPVVPSETQRSPRLSKATPLAPGTPVANTVAVGGFDALGRRRWMSGPSVTNSSPSRSNASPAGPHGAGSWPTITAGPPPAGSRMIGHGPGEVRAGE